MSTLRDVSIDLAVQLGTATMPVHQLLRMGRGAVIALDTLESEDVTLVAQDTPIADGQIILQGERIVVSITKMLMVPPDRRSFGPYVISAPNDGAPHESLAEAARRERAEAAAAESTAAPAADEAGDDMGGDMDDDWAAALAEAEGDDPDSADDAPET